MTKPTTDNSARMAIATLATAAMLLLAWIFAPKIADWQGGNLAQQLAEQIASAKDARVKVPLRQLAELGPPAIVPLVAAAASPRESVSSTARQILNEKWGTWKSLPKPTGRHDQDSYANSTTALASALATSIHEFGPAGQQWAEALALEMIEFANALPAQYSEQLLADCSRILAAVPPRGPRFRTIAGSEALQSNSRSFASDAPHPPLESLSRQSEKALDANRPASVLNFRSSGVRPAPATIEPPSSPLPAPENWSPAWQTNQTEQPPAESRLKAVVSHPEVKTPPVELASSVIDIPTPRAMREQTAALQPLSAEQLLRKLRDATFYEAGVIYTVLRERGYEDAEVHLLRRLASPEVAERLRLVEEVSVLPATSARRWLRWLLEDRSAEVRLRALTALGTTNAPDLTELARELAANDEDTRVSQLANRLLRRVR